MSEFNDFIEAAQTDVHSQPVSNLLDFLGDFLDAHCEEEIQMRATGYPRFQEHEGFHDGLRTRVNRLLAAFKKDPKAVEAETFEVVTDWIENHILIEDKLMAKHLIQFTRKRTAPMP